MSLPKHIDHAATQEHLFGLARGLQLPANRYPAMVEQTMIQLKSMGWHFVFVNQKHGYCAVRGGVKSIALPVWVLDTKHRHMLIWYIAHECAHAVNQELDGSITKCGHGPQFMYRLKQICPPEHLHYEVDYKPRYAAAAGITKETR